MKAQLTPGLRCHQHPVLVPAREKLHGEHRGGLRAQIRVCRLSIGEAACQGADVVQVHPESVGQAQLASVNLDGCPNQLLQTPELGAQAGQRTLIGGVGPQVSSHPDSADGLALQGEVDKETLGTSREGDAGATAIAKTEASQHCQMQTLSPRGGRTC